MSDMDPTIVHRDVQTRKPWFAWPVVLGVAAVAWWGFIEQIVMGQPWGSKPAPNAVLWVIWLACGVFTPLFMLTLRLIIEVRPDEVLVRYIPVWKKRIAMDEIASAESVTFHPMRDWAGWGIRWRAGGGWAYTISGNEGVQLQLNDGKKRLLGARDANALEAAIMAQMGSGE